MTSASRQLLSAIVAVGTAGLATAIAPAASAGEPPQAALSTALAHKLDAALARRYQAALRAHERHGGDALLDVLILLESPTVRQGMGAFPNPTAKRAALAQRLRETAESSQLDLERWLDGHHIEYRSYWIANAIAARIPATLLPQLSARQDVRLVESDAAHHSVDPQPAKSAVTTLAGEPWGVVKIRAPDVWALGYKGQGVVVAGQDTGYQWDHPALQAKYRGWNGASADHNYSWHDAIRSFINAGNSNSCGLNSPVPCDDDAHGTHTMGTMVGDDGGANPIGVAPDAKWIGCRNMEAGDGRPSTYIECFQWFVEPTDLAGNNPDASKAPDVINNSWACPPSELCDAGATATMQSVVQNVRDAGIVVVVSAGNEGGSCGTVQDPAAIFPESLTVGATGNSDAIASFSSRGPVVGGLLKPNVSAPGVNTCSSVPGNGYSCSFSGTSMAGPHVAGTVALIVSANPALRGDPDTIQAILESTAVQLTSMQNCGSFSGSTIPNAVFGYGRIDAYAAVLAARAMLPASVFADGFE